MKLIMISVISGAVLEESLRLLYITTGINSCNLLFKFYYYRLFGLYCDSGRWIGMIFHYIVCYLAYFSFVHLFYISLLSFQQNNLRGMTGMLLVALVLHILSMELLLLN